MQDVREYISKIPLLPIEAELFFQMEIENGKLKRKNVVSFCDFLHKKYKLQKFPQPSVVAAICDILYQNHQITRLHIGGLDGTGNEYLSNLDDHVLHSVEMQHIRNKLLCYIVCGFKYIYEEYSNYVLPIEHTNETGEKSLGTGFLYLNGFVTAKHCIEGAKSLSIRGISPDEIAASNFKIHENKMVDLAFLPLNRPGPNFIHLNSEGAVLDDVMAMGYPNIPGFHNFVTGEKAQVSSRFTATVGAIAAKAPDIWMKEQLFLITAKIKGGNSGGPVIKDDGSVIGVSVNEPMGKRDYDDLGYGTVIPIRLVHELMIDGNQNELDIKNMQFLNFEE